MRESGFVSTGPNLAKSTSGQAGRLNGSAPPPFAVTGAVFERAPLTNACTSVCRMRLLGPLPWTWCRSTPSSRANLRTEGLACGLAPISSWGALGTGRGAGAGAAARALGAGLEGACAGADVAEGALAAAAGAPSAVAERTRMGEPLDTLSPTLIFSSRTTPWEGDGISIVALSDSSVMSDCSFATASPGLTSTSMTSTSLKSPMSGTGTVVEVPSPAGLDSGFN